MDADFSHDPKYIPDFLKKIDENFDLVIGSRYVKGGNVVNWDLKRKATSKGANLIAKTLTGIKVNDATAGYRAYKKEVLEKINLDKIKSKSYDFQIEMVFIVEMHKFKIAEIPIIFLDRDVGTSKLHRKDIIKFFLLCLSLGFKRLKFK
jgi:dolichol-phosphate mannosyltransferase